MIMLSILRFSLALAALGKVQSERPPCEDETHADMANNKAMQAKTLEKMHGNPTSRYHNVGTVCWLRQHEE